MKSDNSQEISIKQYTPNTNYYTPKPGYTPYLRVCGKGVVSQKDANINMWPRSFDPGEYTSIEFDDGITAVKGGFLETFIHIENLILSRTVQSIAETKALSTLLTNNHVLVRGIFDTFAEEFAKMYHLRFVHANIVLAQTENQYETDIWTLRFENNGKPYAHCNAFGQRGFMGGEARHELQDGLFEDCSVEAFAKQFGNAVAEQILQNEALKIYLVRLKSRR